MRVSLREILFGVTVFGLALGFVVVNRHASNRLATSKYGSARMSSANELVTIQQAWASQGSDEFQHYLEVRSISTIENIFHHETTMDQTTLYREISPLFLASQLLEFLGCDDANSFRKLVVKKFSLKSEDQLEYQEYLSVESDEFGRFDKFLKRAFDERKRTQLID